MRSIRAATSLEEGTPSLFKALATRSSKMLSSLSHWPVALLPMSPGHAGHFVCGVRDALFGCRLCFALQAHAFFHQQIKRFATSGLSAAEGTQTRLPYLLR